MWVLEIKPEPSGKTASARHPESPLGPLAHPPLVLACSVPLQRRLPHVRNPYSKLACDHTPIWFGGDANPYCPYLFSCLNSRVAGTHNHFQFREVYSSGTSSARRVGARGLSPQTFSCGPPFHLARRCSCASLPPPGFPGGERSEVMNSSWYLSPKYPLSPL